MEAVAYTKQDLILRQTDGLRPEGWGFKGYGMGME